MHDDKSQWRRTQRRAGLLAAALAGAGLLITACSSGPASPGVAGGTSPAASSSGGSAKTSALAYSQCMRSHGLSDFPDPNSQGGIALSAGPGSDLDPNNPRFQAAQHACGSLLPAHNLTPAQQAQMRSANLRYAQCMRSHGISGFPDPNAQGQLQVKAQPGSNLDPNNPRYQSADKACRHFEPGGGIGGSLSQSGTGGGSGS